jgi:CubicO group peptidase (beta-lactamase class C family)
MLYRGLGVDLGVPMASADDFYRFVNGATDEAVVEPGQRFFYHNAGWRILGHVLQTLSGKPFHQYLQENVIDLLGMPRTTLTRAEFESDANRIVSHSRDAEGKAVPTQFPYPDPNDNPGFSFLSAAGGITSSVNEMTRYLNLLLNQGSYPGGQLLRKESFEKMQHIHIEEEPGYFGRSGYGYGLAITPDFLGCRLIGHGGSVIVSTAHLSLIPELGIGVISMANSGGIPLAFVNMSILAILAGEDPSEALPFWRVRKRMKLLVGKYETYRRVEKIQVLKKSGMLYLENKDRLSGTTDLAPLIPHDPMLNSMNFYLLNDGLRDPVEFRIDKDKGTELIIGRYRYRKVD